MTTAQQLLERARELVPGIRERACDAERLRSLPPETVAELGEAGILRALQPRAFGGDELSMRALVELSAEVARGCGSSGWCTAIFAVHNWMLGLFPAQAQRDVWGKDPRALSVAVFAPTGTSEPVEGGHRLSGRWSFGSGCDHSQWALLSAIVPGDTPELRMHLVPRADFGIDDTWHVAGLCATGSKDVVTEGALVPPHRSVGFAELMAEQSPGLAVHAGPLFRVPFMSGLAVALAGPAIGIARGAVEAYEERLKSRITGRLAPHPERLPSLIRLAEASAETDAAELLLLRAADQMDEAAAAGEPSGPEDRVRHRRDVAHCVRMCTRAVDRLFEDAGAHGLHQRSPLQRAFRDLHALSAHAFIHADACGELYGRMRTGQALGGAV